MNIQTMHTPFVYKWTHLPTLMWYVGSRTAKRCHPSDGYLCSSKTVKPLILKNPDEWKREIIATGSAEEMRELEVEILQLFDARNDPHSFNMHNGDGDANLCKARDARADRVRGARLVDFNPAAAAQNESRRGKKLSEFSPNTAAVHDKNRGRPASEWRPNLAAINENNRGRPVSEWRPALAAVNKARQRAVIRTSVEMGSEVYFESLSLAAESVGTQPPNIFGALTGRQKTCKGYTFRYATDEDATYHNTPRKGIIE